MINLKKLLIKIISNPLVIETGTITRTMNNNSTVNCTWKYRKWSDGTYDLWGIIPDQSYAMTQQSGTGYYLQIAVAYPTIFQNSNFIPDIVTAGRLGGSSGNGLVTVKVSGVAYDYTNFWVFSTYSETQTFSICVYVHGHYR